MLGRVAKNGREIVDKMAAGFMMISLTLFNGKRDG
jgi:hypothetical protein